MSEHPGYRDGSWEPPGPLADEAARLVGAAQDWWHRTTGGARPDGGGRGSPDNATGSPGIATGAAECCWCPVCQAIATVRGDRPDILERLAETQAAVTGLLRALADTTAAGRASRPADQAQESGPRAPRVQEIILNSDTDTDTPEPGPGSDSTAADDAADPEQDGN
ncbi:hypothetical protein [Jatrophihabitans lederbergiae]|uniref:Uncharacterized protein n=1 Tax=Jatrophihabitans lederbergiae TaxID=3075547 RepID=A0ABU2J8Q7_9ACTN|nr:hypothetical protein [Jatrophihabitans sp. DSM 44399]MDT0261361.1 hypothetical protein [Jatrophihabitans sp. DSM 44399]